MSVRPQLVPVIVTAALFGSMGFTRERDTRSPDLESRVSTLESKLSMIDSRISQIEVRSHQPVNDYSGQRRVGDLERQLSALEIRIARMEQSSSRAEVPPPPSQPDVTLDGWTSLKRGMTKDDVSDLLGFPNKTTTTNGRDTWYYAKTGGGFVRFDRSGHVSSWSRK
jgi:hypothetical protein